MDTFTSFRAPVTYSHLQQEAQARQLTILGGFHPTPDDELSPQTKTLLLIGPLEPGFWMAFKQSSEWQDGQSDPLDRWSSRVFREWAARIDAEALFPFGGPPFLPFFTWAQRTGRIHTSPIRFLVHDVAGLFVSFRGALALCDHVDLPPPPPAPCLTCDAKPCMTACPVGALDGTSYDVPACNRFLDTADGKPCMTLGCAARRICPVSQSYPRVPEQSAYHMNQFKR